MVEKEDGYVDDHDRFDIDPRRSITCNSIKDAMGLPSQQTMAKSVLLLLGIALEKMGGGGGAVDLTLFLALSSAERLVNQSLLAHFLVVRDVDRDVLVKEFLGSLSCDKSL